MMITRVFVNTWDSGEWAVLGEFHGITPMTNAVECIQTELIHSYDIMYPERAAAIKAVWDLKEGHVLRCDELERSYFWTLDRQETGDEL